MSGRRAVEARLRMADRGLFFSRGDELRRWRVILQDARAPTSDDRRGSFVVLVHGIGGMGKSRLVRRSLRARRAR
jgi:hypothetical protein